MGIIIPLYWLRVLSSGFTSVWSFASFFFSLPFRGLEKLICYVLGPGVPRRLLKMVFQRAHNMSVISLPVLVSCFYTRLVCCYHPFCNYPFQVCKSNFQCFRLWSSHGCFKFIFIVLTIVHKSCIRFVFFRADPRAYGSLLPPWFSLPCNSLSVRFVAFEFSRV